MDATFKRIIIAGISFIAIAACLVAIVVSGSCTRTETDPLADTKVGVLNTVIDISGIKERIDDEVRAKAAQVAEETGIPAALADNVVDSLAISEWQATPLPDDATETGTYHVETENVSAEITTYDDPSIVTVTAYGQTVTMAVPESAQNYTALIGYLQYLQ